MRQLWCSITRYRGGLGTLSFTQQQEFQDAYFLPSRENHTSRQNGLCPRVSFVRSQIKQVNRQFTIHLQSVLSQSARPSCLLTILPSVHQSVSLFVCHSGHPYVCLSVNQSASQSVRQSVNPFVSQSVSRSVSQWECLSVRQYIRQSLNLRLSTSSLYIAGCFICLRPSRTVSFETNNFGQSIHLSLRQLVSQPVSPFVSPSLHQSMRQSARGPVRPCAVSRSVSFSSVIVIVKKQAIFMFTVGAVEKEPYTNQFGPT